MAHFNTLQCLRASGYIKVTISEGRSGGREAALCMRMPINWRSTAREVERYDGVRRGNKGE